MNTTATSASPKGLPAHRTPPPSSAVLASQSALSSEALAKGELRNPHSAIAPHSTPPSAPRLLAALVCVAVPPLLLFLLPALRQDQTYHAFVDQRTWHGLPNILDVLTNLPLLLAGLFGLREAYHQPATPRRAGWLAFFGGLTLVGFGSTWYHLAPTDASIVWDRLPLSIMFTSLFATALSETISDRLGRRALLPAIAFGLASVFWWQHYDDLRPYFAAQSLALIGVPALLALFPRRGEGRSWLVAGLGCYALAFAAERADSFVFTLTGGTFSGHSLKHCLAALACTAVAAMLRSRRLAARRQFA